MAELKLRVRRFDPSIDTTSRVQEYSVPALEGMTVLDALIYAKDRLDHGLAVRFSCRMASCGSCGMKVNGRPRLACESQVSALGTTITVEPMDNFPIVRDLVVDLGAFFEKHAEVSPHLARSDTDEQGSPTGEYLVSPKELDSFVQFTYCIKCGLCSSSCPTASTDRSFLGPQALAQAYRYSADPRDEGADERADVVDDAHGIWRCHFAGTCSAVCPKGVDPALGIQLMKRYVMSSRSLLGRKRRKREPAAGVFPNINSDLLKRPADQGAGSE